MNRFPAAGSSESRLERSRLAMLGCPGRRSRLPISFWPSSACSSPRSIRAPARSGRRPASRSPPCCLGGLRIWPAIFVGAFAANATTAGTLETSAVIAVGNTLEGVVGGYLIARWSGGAADLRHPGAGGEIRAGLRRAGRPSSAPRIGVLDAVPGRLCRLGEFRPDLDHLVAGRRRRRAGGHAGDRAVGATPTGAHSTGSELRDIAAVLGCAVAVGLIAFSPLLPRSEYTSPLGFLAILPLVWAALRRGPRDTATVGLILTGLRGLGHDRAGRPVRDKSGSTNRSCCCSPS